VFQLVSACHAYLIRYHLSQKRMTRDRHFRGIKRRSRSQDGTRLFDRVRSLSDGLVYLAGRFPSLVFRLNCSAEAERPFPGQSWTRAKRAAESQLTVHPFVRLCISARLVFQPSSWRSFGVAFKGNRNTETVSVRSFNDVAELLTDRGESKTFEFVVLTSDCVVLELEKER